jgi:hypothetical protein
MDKFNQIGPVKHQNSVSRISADHPNFEIRVSWFWFHQLEPKHFNWFFADQAEIFMVWGSAEVEKMMMMSELATLLIQLHIYWIQRQKFTWEELPYCAGHQHCCCMGQDLVVHSMMGGTINHGWVRPVRSPCAVRALILILVKTRILKFVFWTKISSNRILKFV